METLQTSEIITPEHAKALFGQSNFTGTNIEEVLQTSDRLFATLSNPETIA